MVRQVVVQVGEGDFVLCSDRLSDDDLVDVIELIPVFIPAEDTDKDHLRKNLASILTFVWGKTGLTIKQLKETCKF